MRSIYVIYFFENNKSLKSRQELAKQMRHSVPTAMRAYYKITDEKLKEINEELKTLKQENIKLQIEINELKQKLNEIQPDDKLYNKRRHDIIYRLNLN